MPDRKRTRPTSDVNLTSTYQLRDAIPADASAIVAWFPTHAEAVLWGGPEVPPTLDVEWLTKQFEDGTRRYLVLVDADDGICGAYALRQFDEERRLHIGRFGVAPNLRGRGLGTVMLDAAVLRARNLQAEKLTLYVYDGNPRARRLYERYGFRDTDAAVQTGADQMVLMEFVIRD